MAFFNYSTMQLTAKIVYYGPGLCGKTTNLQYIYGHSTDESRGEMVSLETQTDRTLFFDLLPMEVGTVAGFRTRLQLYTVPGQVFYNTTRKLVLKGVDGVVFVADSQRPMFNTNAESLRNLETNLGSLGIGLDSIPLVLQFNKRDLPDIVPVEELNRLLNRNGWPYFEASAITGAGVFETLRGISRLTLLALKRQLESGTPAGTPRVRPAAESPAAPAPPARPAPAPAAPAPPSPSPAATGRPAGAAPSGNGAATLRRDLMLTLKRPQFQRARRVLVSLQFQDEQQEILHEVKDLPWDIARSPAPGALRLRLDIDLNSED